jgi:hypothetical protein
MRSARPHETLHLVRNNQNWNNSGPRVLGVRRTSGGFGGWFVFVIQNSLAVRAEVDLKMLLDFIEQLRR